MYLNQFAIFAENRSQRLHQALYALPVLLLGLVVLLWSSVGAQSTRIHAQTSLIGPMLFVVTTDANQPLFPPLTADTTIHAQTQHADQVDYLVSGSQDTQAAFTASGFSVREIVADTAGKVYYWIDTEAPTTSPQASTLYAGNGQALVAIKTTDEAAWLDTARAQGNNTRSLRDSFVDRPEFTQPVANMDQRQAAANAATNTIANCDNLVVNGDLEGSGGWSYGPTPARGAAVTSPVHGGGGAIRLGIVEGSSNVYSFSTAYQRVTIPAAAPKVLLTYWEQPGTSADNGDYRELYVLRTNYSILRQLTRVRSAGSGEWTQQSFDLSDFRGQTVVLYFNVFNNGSGSRMVNYLDDIVLVPCAAEPSATPTSPPTATATATDMPTDVPTDVPTSTPTNTPTAMPEPTATPVPSSTPEPTSTPAPDDVVIRVGSANGSGQSSVSVPLEMANIPAEISVGVVSANVLYDTNVLLATSCATGEGFDLILCNINEAGKVQLSAIAVSGVSSDILLAQLDFDILRSNTESALTVEIESVKDTDSQTLPAIAQHGAVTFDSCDAGDVDCDSDLTAKDALLILQFDIGSITGSDQIPPPAGTLHEPACDVNDDAECGIVDALFVLQCIVGESNALCSVGADPILPEGRNSDADVTLRVGTIPAGTTGELSIPVTALVPAGISATALELQYDPALLTVRSCTANPAGHFEHGDCNASYDADGGAPDVVRFNALTAAAVTGEVTLAEIVIEPKVELTTDITLQLTVRDVVDSTGDAVSTVVEGQADEPTFNLYMPTVQR